MNPEVPRARCEGGTLVCFALKEEAGPFRRIADGTRNLSILFTGIGRANAQQTLREFLTANSPEIILTCGFAGGLNPNFASGSILFSTDDEALREKLEGANARPAKIHCASRIAITLSDKAGLRQSTGADAVEMESEVIQAICRERGIPCATVRAISDAAHEELPLDFNQLSKPDMNLDYRKLAWAIAKSPKKIGALLRLRKQCLVAAERLAVVLAKITADH